MRGESRDVSGHMTLTSQETHVGAERAMQLPSVDSPGLLLEVRPTHAGDLCGYLSSGVTLVELVLLGYHLCEEQAHFWGHVLLLFSFIMVWVSQICHNFLFSCNDLGGPCCCSQVVYPVMYRWEERAGSCGKQERAMETDQ